jgi:hypothetical protein
LLTGLAMKPPELTNTNRETRCGSVIANRAAAKPPTEFPMNAAGGNSSAATTSTRTSAKEAAVGR